MNITNNSIQYIASNNKVQTFKIPKEDRNINFKKWSYNDVMQYIKLNEQKPKNKPKSKSKSTKKNVIKYAKLTTVRNNPLINGKKTLDQLKAEAIIAINEYGIKSKEYKTLIGQITQYAQLILNKYYEDYIKQNVGFSNFEIMKNQMGAQLLEKLRQIVEYGKCFKLKIDKSNNETSFNAAIVEHHASAFSELLGFNFVDDYHIENDEKLYFPFKIPNEYSPHDVEVQIVKTIGMTNFKNLKQFYQPIKKYENYFVMDFKECQTDKKDQIINDGLFPAFLTSLNDDQVIYIPLDIFDYAMSINNGKIRSKIYYCQFNNFDMSQKFKIIGDDIIDYNFIKYFMDDTITFKGGDTKIAFMTKILDNLLVKMNLNISKYKDLYDNKENNITGDDVKTIFKEGDYDVKMEEEKEEEKTISSKDRMKKLKEDYIKNKKNKNDNVYLTEFNTPDNYPEFEPIVVDDDDKKPSSKERMKKIKEDYKKNKKNKNDNVYLTEFNKPIIPKSTSPIVSTEVTEVEEVKPITTEDGAEHLSIAQPIEGVKPIEEFKPKPTSSKPTTEFKPIDPSTLKDDDEKKETKTFNYFNSI